MKSTLAISAFVFFAAGIAHAQDDDIEVYRQKAMRGDYQAQRNTAFCLSEGKCREMAKRPIQACAWRIVILGSGSLSIDRSDISNYQFYCVHGISAQERAVATQQAGNLFLSIYNRPLPEGLVPD